MNSSDFDQRFDDGESVLEALDLTRARRQRLELKRINVDFPLSMVEQIDREASRMGVTRQSIIKMWLAERLDRQPQPTNAAALHTSETLGSTGLSHPSTHPPMRHNLGRVLATAALAAAVPQQQITALLDRHSAGDWGSLGSDDMAANDEAARTGDGRLFSSYDTAEHGTIWIITNDIRSEGEGPITTVLFPDDY